VTARQENHAEQERRRAACQQWLDAQRLPDGTLPFDRLVADRAFAAGWQAKRAER
jgi:hypothetical protein